MRVFITGATGLVGSHIAATCLAAGHGVRALIRSSSRLDNLADLNIETVSASLDDPASLEAAMAGCDAVIHSAGLASWSPLDRERCYQVNVEGTRHVVDAAIAAGCQRFVLTSSISAVGATLQPELLTEASVWSPQLGRIPYMDSKRQAERLALAKTSDDFQVVAVCPGFVLGPGDIYGSSSSIVAAVVRGRMPAFVEGGASMVCVRDVAAGHVGALERGRPGQRYILGGQNLTMSEFMALVAQESGAPVPRKVPYALAYLPAYLADFRARWSKARQPLSRNLLAASSRYTFASSAKAEDELGYSARSVRSALTDTLRDFVSRGKLRPTTPELERLCDEREEGEGDQHTA